MKNNFHQEINLKGEICPYTFIKTKLILEEMKYGEILKIILDYEPAAKNIPRQINQYGEKILKINKNKKNWEIWIKKNTYD